MTKVLVLYYSSYGHIETMAKAVAAGAAEVEGVEVTVKRVPETVPEDVAKSAHIKLDQDAPIARPDELAEYDAIIFGAPTRFGPVGKRSAMASPTWNSSGRMDAWCWRGQAAQWR